MLASSLTEVAVTNTKGWHELVGGWTDGKESEALSLWIDTLLYGSLGLQGSALREMPLGQEVVQHPRFPCCPHYSLHRSAKVSPESPYHYRQD